MVSINPMGRRPRRSRSRRPVLERKDERAGAPLAGRGDQRPALVALICSAAHGAFSPERRGGNLEDTAGDGNYRFRIEAIANRYPRVSCSRNQLRPALDEDGARSRLAA